MPHCICYPILSASDSTYIQDIVIPCQCPLIPRSLLYFIDYQVLGRGCCMFFLNIRHCLEQSIMHQSHQIWCWERDLWDNLHWLGCVSPGLLHLNNSRRDSWIQFDQINLWSDKLSIISIELMCWDSDYFNDIPQKVSETENITVTIWAKEWCCNVLIVRSFNIQENVVQDQNNVSKVTCRH